MRQDTIKYGTILRKIVLGLLVETDKRVLFSANVQ